MFKRIHTFRSHFGSRAFVVVMIGNVSSDTGVRVLLVLLLLGALTTFLLFAPRSLHLEAVTLGLLVLYASLRHTRLVGLDVRGAAMISSTSSSQSEYANCAKGCHSSQSASNTSNSTVSNNAKDAATVSNTNRVFSRQSGQRHLLLRRTRQIQEAGRYRQWWQAVQILHDMPRQGLQPDVITYSAAISACAKGQQPERALELLAEMLERGLDPNVITYNVAISACKKGQQPERALELLAEMKVEGLSPT